MLAVLTLPVVTSTIEKALRKVSGILWEASLFPSAHQSQTIILVVLPVAIPGILTGAILGLARAAGKTAVIMFTAAVFFTKAGLDSVFRPAMALPNYILAVSGT